MKRRDPMAPHALVAFLEGEVTRSEAARIESELADSAVARRRLAQLREIRSSLTELPDELAGVDLVAGVRQAIAKTPAPAPARRVWLRGGLFAAMAVVALTLVIARQLATPREAADEFRVKSADPAAAEDRWVRIDVFRVNRDGAARPLGATGGALQSGDGLVFRYTDVSPEPFGYLMIFAIDAAHEIHWYYPGYEAAGSDPASLAIRSRGSDIALADAIHHDLRPGPLVIYALFTRQPLRVLDIEQRLREQVARPDWDPAAPPRAPVPGSAQDVVHARVIR
ncbi:MAG TPA: hypothetical protein VLM79_10185 [Kofleriaceae bacterium]|nr:hypothetical protein [Kofleriaceae bacterium]